MQSIARRAFQARALVIFVMAATPFMTSLDSASKLTALVGLTFFLSLFRGLSYAAWMPWITRLIPEEVRGRFLSIDHFFANAGDLASLLLTAMLVSGAADPWEYSLVFSIAALGGVVTMYFISRTPDVRVEKAMRHSSESVPWRAMVTQTSFRELVIFNAIYAMVIGSFGVFTVEYLNDFSDFGVRSVLALSGCSFAGALVIVPLCGRIIDTTGSKPLMFMAIGMLGSVIAGWALIATDFLSCSHTVAAALNTLAGASTVIFSVANVRIAMGTMPEIGRNYFFAFVTVITSLGLGGAPVAWGIILDVIGSFEVATGFFHWKRHSIYFVGLLALDVIALAWIARLHESAPSPASGSFPRGNQT